MTCGALEYITPVFILVSGLTIELFFKLFDVNRWKRLYLLILRVSTLASEALLDLLFLKVACWVFCLSKYQQWLAWPRLCSELYER